MAARHCRLPSARRDAAHYPHTRSAPRPTGKEIRRRSRILLTQETRNQHNQIEIGFHFRRKRRRWKPVLRESLWSERCRVIIAQPYRFLIPPVKMRESKSSLKIKRAWSASCSVIQRGRKGSAGAARRRFAWIAAS